MMEAEKELFENKVKRRSSFGRPRISIGIPSDIENNKFMDQEPSEKFQEPIGNVEFNKTKLNQLLSYINQLKTEQQSWRDLLSKYEAQANACQESSEAVNVTIEYDVRCLSDVGEKYRSVLQSSPDYNAVVSSLHELNYCNNLCGDIVVDAAKCLKLRYCEPATFVHDQISRINRLVSSDTMESIMSAMDVKIGNES